MSATESDWRGTGVRGITPLYKRLPKGPHGFAPEEVIHHQRIRMHGAMIEAVAEHGYERMSVKHVIGLAGVSRRAFYEQFANKEDCFMETFDLIVNRTIKRVTGACRANDGPLEERLRAGLRAFVEEIETNSKALHLVAIDALTAGPEGLLRQRRALAACEHLVSASFASPPAEGELPAPLVRAIVGGLHRTTLMRLREPDRHAESQSVMTGEMLRWMLLFASPAVGELRLRAGSQRPLPRVVRLPELPAGATERDRLLASIVNLALREPFEELSAPHVATEAGLPIDTFLDLFESPQECFKAALDMLGGELLEAVADPALVSPDWPAAVCQAIARLTSHLAGNPASAVMLAAKTMSAGLGVVEDMVLLADEVTTLLTEGAPRRARTRLAPKWISGALAYTLHTEAMAGRIHLLECLSDYLSYVVLAPFIGPDRAAQTIAQNALAPPAHEVENAVAPTAREVERAGAELAEERPRATESAPDAEDTDEAGEAEEPGVFGEITERADAAVVENPAAVLVAEELAAPVGATLGEVGEDDAGEQRDHDDDDERDLAGAEDPTDLDLAEIEDGEQSDKHRQRHPRPGARQFSL
jgi:AcrR family transcriptional regulator